MSFEVEQGSKAIIFAHFLKQNGVEATITGTPTITIRHYSETTSAIVTDVSAENMTQVLGSLYYYIWAYADIVKTQFAATFAATYDTGESVTGTETFTIRSHKIIGAAVGPWTIDDKNRVLELIEQIARLVRNREGVQALQAAIDKLSTSESVQSIGVDNLQKDISTIVENFSKLQRDMDDLRENVDIQSKIVTKIADPKILEEVLNEQKDE